MLTDMARDFKMPPTNASMLSVHRAAGRIDDLPNSSMAISFISHLADERFLTPPGLDLSPLLTQGNAVLLAWEPDYSPIKPINLFPTRRSHKDTLWRIAAPVAMYRVTLI